jgi:hypothetical protein
MYADLISVNGDTLYQGDIISDFHFHILENGVAVKKDETGGVHMATDADNNDAALLMIETKKTPVMILSQSCDIQRRNNVIICPVYNLATFVSDNTINSDTLRSIRGRKIYYWFYLPAFGSIQESIADLQTMVYIPRSIVEKYLPKRIASLNDLGRHHLGWTLANYFGRPAE